MIDSLNKNQNPANENTVCARCHGGFICQPETIVNCHCNRVRLNQRQREWIAERWQGCLCNVCLLQVQQEVG